ncbi:MAG: TetR/AcrR family transcriptional regulator [Aeromicrobium sp.]
MNTASTKADGAVATRRRAATRERLIDAAREVLASDGIQGASVEHICDRAGFTRGAFYSNFTSKEDLVLAVFNREKTLMFESLKAAADPASFEGKDLKTAIDEVIDRFVVFQPGDRDWFLVNAEFAIHGIRQKDVGREFNEAWGQAKAEFQAFMTQTVKALGRRFTIDPRHAATILMGTYELTLREALIEGRPIDTVLLRESLPMVLLSVTEETP